MRKNFIFTVLFLLCINVYSDEIADKISAFWNYISKNEQKIYEIDNQNTELYNEIYFQIQSINEELYVMSRNY